MSISEVEVVPLATDVETSDDELTVALADGRRISVPLVWFPRLLDATSAERAEFRLIGGGEGIHWPRVDEDISVAALLRGSRVHTHPSYDDIRRPSGNEFRRREHEHTWHWCPGCSFYPAEDYFLRTSSPSSGLCAECTARAGEGRC